MGSKQKRNVRTIHPKRKTTINIAALPALGSLEKPSTGWYIPISQATDQSTGCLPSKVYPEMGNSPTSW